MKMFHDGDKSKGICALCQKVVSTTFVYKDVPFSDGVGVVKDILVAVCDACDAIVATPPQSTPAIKAAREKACDPFEVVLPAPLIEILDLAARRIDPDADAGFRKYLFAFYIDLNLQNFQEEKNLSTYAQAYKLEKMRWNKNIPRKRLSFKMKPRMNTVVDDLQKRFKIKSRTNLTGAVVMQIRDEIITPDLPLHFAELKRVAAVLAA
jgi:hypothetical protein